ncbi:MAG: NUDIX domain-containing protein [Thermoproteota archaeon]
MVFDERSAGAVLFREGDGGGSSSGGNGNKEPQYLLLHYTAGHWDFPKGNIEQGETEHEAAAREIREETGISDIEFIDGFERTISYRYRKARRLVDKEVVFFLARTSGASEVKISHEHTDHAWRKYEDAVKLVTFKNARDLLAAARAFLLSSSSQSSSSSLRKT